MEGWIGDSDVQLSIVREGTAMNVIAPSEADQVPLESMDVSDASLHQRNVALDYFRRLRREDPVHYCANSQFGPYWSLTRHRDCMYVDTNHQLFSSAGTVVIDDQFFTGGHIENETKKTSFIVMDPPRHTEPRKVVAPALAPANILKFEAGIRERTQHLLDSLPVNETFDWVSEVARELTVRMLAIMFDFPFEERHKLLYWSDVQIGFPGDGVVESWEHRSEVLKECGERFTAMFNEKLKSPPQSDLLSILAHSPAMRDMSPDEFLGTCTLLMTGGNDTTRNSMSGSVLAMNLFPDQFRKLKENPGLIPGMVPEIIRWQNPVTYMRRSVTQDTEIGGKKIRRGERVVMWYLSGNRDEEVFENADDFIIDRPNARQHLSFGFGIHRCLGNRLAEMQLKVLWEELLPRFSRIELAGEPVRLYSNMFRGFSSMPVRVHR
jgi:cytochrome P450